MPSIFPSSEQSRSSRTSARWHASRTFVAVVSCKSRRLPKLQPPLFVRHRPVFHARHSEVMRGKWQARQPLVSTTRDRCKYLERKFREKSRFSLVNPKPNSLAFFLNPDRMNATLRKSFFIAFSSVVAALALGRHLSWSGVVPDHRAAPDFDNLPSPQFAGVKNKRFTPLDWLEIEAPLKVEMKPEPASKTCDKMTVKWYVAVKNVEKPGTFLLFSKEIEHVNVPLNEEIYSSVFISPASLSADHRIRNRR